MTLEMVDKVVMVMFVVGGTFIAFDAVVSYFEKLYVEKWVSSHRARFEARLKDNKHECDTCRDSGVVIIENQGQDGGIDQVETKCLCRVDK